MEPTTLNCFQPTCRAPATERRPVRLGGGPELLWTCKRHAEECLVYGCGRPASERLVLLMEGRLERLTACPRHARWSRPRRLRRRPRARRS